MSDLQFWLSNLGTWFVTPLVIFLVLIKPLLWFRYLLFRIAAHFLTRWRARNLKPGERCLVIALPFYFTTKRRQHYWTATDHFFTARQQGFLGGWFLYADRLNPEKESRSAERFVAQAGNHLGTYYRGLFEWMFDWIGFTGAVRASAPQIHGYVAHKTMDELLIASLFGVSRRLWGHGLRERLPSYPREPGMSWTAKIEEGRRRVTEAMAKIDEDTALDDRARRYAVLIEEARIAANLAEYAGEAVRLLRSISPEQKTLETILEQLPALLSNIYQSETMRIPVRPQPTSPIE